MSLSRPYSGGGSDVKFMAASQESWLTARRHGGRVAACSTGATGEGALGPMRIRLLLGAAALSLAVLLPASSLAASGTWERAWGENVDSGTPATGFEICTVI